MDAQRNRTLTVTVVGLASLAAAMGIGRFAFTPLLPLMQDAFGLSLSRGAWLATANYIGYFIGAASGFLLNPRSGSSARWGLLTVAVSTIATGLTASFEAWFVLRLVSGIGSAFVLVGASSWALSHLSALGKPQASGWVFSGVGIGMSAAGIVALVAGMTRASPDYAWFLFGGLCTAITAAVWRPLSLATSSTQVQTARTAPALERSEWTLVACYGVLGFGYIIPATFIPASARALVSDPAVFGWTWPVFGLAAAASTATVSAFFADAPPRRVAAWSLVVMAVGVLVPMIGMSLPSLVISALCVGGTFMVATMAGAQEARRIAAGSPTKLMSAMTAAFAAGQIAGPVLVGIGGATARVVAWTSGLAVALLLLSACVLLLTGARGSNAGPHNGAVSAWP